MLLLSVIAVVWSVDKLYFILKKAVLIVLAAIVDQCVLEVTVMVDICTLIHCFFSRVNRCLIYENKTFCPDFS